MVKRAEGEGEERVIEGKKREKGRYGVKRRKRRSRRRRPRGVTLLNNPIPSS